MKLPGLIGIIVVFILAMTLIITISFIGSPIGELPPLEPTEQAIVYPDYFVSGGILLALGLIFVCVFACILFLPCEEK